MPRSRSTTDLVGVNDRPCGVNDLSRREGEVIDLFPKLRSEKRKISNEKFRDLMTILQWVPEEYKAYFENLPHGASENDFPDISSTLLD
ncbi:hypothetical protein J6590_104987 [Homalodisca vitripennis]|nr:hypothetical protein J6590_104987 [Homalodisca vitripennis]